MSSGLTSAIIEIDGVGLYTEWRVAAVAGKPTLVFLHDGLGCCAGWHDFPDALAKATGRGAFAYDRWGYGRSDAREAFPADFTEDAARRLPLVLAAAEIGDHIVIGHSDGATIALQYAAGDPKGLRCAVSIGAHVHNDASVYAQLLRHQRFVDQERMPEGMTAFHGNRALKLMGNWVKAWRAALDDGWNLADTMTNIRVPLLAVHGADDEYGLPAQLESISKSAPGAEARLLAGLGHSPHLDDPDTLIFLIAEFVTRHGG